MNELNIKEKMIEAMWKVYDHGDCNMTDILDAALLELADPKNWTDDMDKAADAAYDVNERSWSKNEFAAIINHIRGLS